MRLGPSASRSASLHSRRDGVGGYFAGFRDGRPATVQSDETQSEWRIGGEAIERITWWWRVSPRPIMLTELSGESVTIDLDEVLYVDSQPDGATTLILETDLVYSVRESPEEINESASQFRGRTR